MDDYQIFEKIERDFPRLRSQRYRKTSERDGKYNCIAWAADDSNRWWEPVQGVPGFYWPTPLSSTSDEDLYTQENYVKAFEAIGYVQCSDGSFEKDYDKVALYVDQTGEPKHAAKQTDSGKWTSKLGRAIDIEHETLDALKSDQYGEAKIFLKRKKGF